MRDVARWPIGRATLRLAALLGAGLSVAPGVWVPLEAQQGTVSGTVVDGKTGRPLPDASVGLEGSGVGVRTGVRGEFRLTGLTGAAVRIRVARVGYQPVTQEAQVDGSPVRVELVEQAVKLDEIVVTGQAGEAQERTLGNAVGRVDVSNTVVLAPPAKLQDLISVNVPGVRIIRASGEVGTGGVTRIRGSGSLSLSNEPLIYVDGVRVNNQAAVASEGLGGWAGSSRVNDLNPEEIESIEVLKGPSAATIYGTEASNGVIQIITKRGRAGRPTFDVHLDGGANWLMNPEGRYSPNYYFGRDGQLHEFRVLEFRNEAGLPRIFSTGTPLAMGASLSGGTDQLRYFFSADFNRDEGYFNYNWQNKYTGRANLTYSTPNDKFKVDVSLGAIRARTRAASGVQAMTTSILWACNFPGCEPDPADPDNTGYNSTGGGFQFYRPEDYYGVFGYDNVDRTMFSLQLNHRPTTWLRHRLTIGPDFVSNRSSLLVERNDSYEPAFFDLSDGFKSGRETHSTYLTVDYGASADFTGVRNLVATTSAGAQYYYKQFDVLRGEGRVFSIPGQSDITGAAQRQAVESFLENKTFGIYAQEQLAWKNRFFLTGAVRADDNSSFGSEFNIAVYPKVSFSWVLSEERFLADSRLLSSLKLRGAWGQAGQQPDIFSAIRTYQPKVGPGGQGGVSPQNIGNLDLKPEIGQEFEVGFDAGLLNDRMGIEFTFYNKDIKDAILSLPNKPSRGFPGFTFVNIGKTRNRGIELAVDGTPIQSRDVSLDLRFTLATNSSRILDLGGTEPSFVGASFVQQWNIKGFAPGSFFYRKVVRSTIQKVPIAGVELPVGFDPICEGGDIVEEIGAGASKVTLATGNGTEVPCAEAPALYHGRPTPAWNGSFSATLNLGRRLRLLGLLDYLGGHTVLVGDIAAVHAFFWNSKAVLEGHPVVSGYLGTLLLQGDANSVGAVGLVKGGFVKLRTVSATYDLPERFVRWLGVSRGAVTVAGENLAILWREQEDLYGVKWIDPEISSNFSGQQSNYGYIQESLPQAARIRTTLRLTF
jgi:TonB-linked SusC/RagA family outer membrane protein